MKWLFTALGGYLLWTWYGSTTSPQSPAAASISPALRAQVAAAAAGEGDMLNFDQWNWYYAKVRQQPGPAWEEIAAVAASLGIATRQALITIDEWVTITAGRVA